VGKNEVQAVLEKCRPLNIFSDLFFVGQEVNLAFEVDLAFEL
jgi:hypothetical protein